MAAALASGLARAEEERYAKPEPIPVLQNRRWWPRQARGIVADRMFEATAGAQRMTGADEDWSTSTEHSATYWPAKSAIYSILVITIGSCTDDTPHSTS